MPGTADVEAFGQGGDFTSDAQSADLGDVDSDEIDQAFGDKTGPLVWVIEEFAHGNGHTGLLTQHLEVADVFRRDRILNEEGTVGATGSPPQLSTPSVTSTTARSPTNPPKSLATCSSE